MTSNGCLATRCSLCRQLRSRQTWPVRIRSFHQSTPTEVTINHGAPWVRRKLARRKGLSLFSLAWPLPAGILYCQQPMFSWSATTGRLGPWCGWNEPCTESYGLWHLSSVALQLPFAAVVWFLFGVDLVWDLERLVPT